VTTGDLTGHAVQIINNLSIPVETHLLLTDVACCMALMRTLGRGPDETRMFALRTLLNLSSTHAVHSELLSPRVQLVNVRGPKP
jgi:hypothetical protein